MDQAERWAMGYAAGAAGLPVFAETVAALGFNPSEVLTRWPVLVEWIPWMIEDR